MNIIDIQDQLKNFSENQLIQEMQMPSGNAPQFLVLSEIQRRKRVRDNFAKQQAANEPTVAEEAVAAAGVPMQGIAGMSEAMAPQSATSGGIGTMMPQSMRQAAPPSAPAPEDMAMGMAGGGLLDSLFKGRESLAEASKRPEVRITKDGRKAMYKPGTNIFLGFVNEDKKMNEGGPLGLRQFNPGNIRPGAGFLGETGAGSGYAQFESPEYGLRALSRLLGTYGQKRGVNTLRGLVSRYAPKSDNPESFENYIKYMSDKLDVDPDEEIDLAGRRAELIPAIVGFEQGQQPFSEDQISRAITASQTDDPDEVSSILNAPLNEILADRGVNASDLFQQDVDSGLMSAMAATPASQTLPIDPGFVAALAAQEDQTTPVEIGTLFGKAVMSDDLGEYIVGEDGEPIYLDENQLAGVDRNAKEEPKPEPTPLGEKLAEEEAKANAAAAAAAAVEKAEDKAVDTTPPWVAKPQEESATTNDTDNKTDQGGTKRSGIEFLTGGADEVSSIESEILKMQQQLGKERETDKWLAIAQAGLSLMSSKEPTLLGAAGEAGVEGLKAFREAQTRYQEGVIDLLNARAKIKDNKKGITSSSAVSRLNKIEELLNPTDPAAMPLDPETKTRLEEEAKYLRRSILGYSDIVA